MYGNTAITSNSFQVLSQDICLLQQTCVAFVEQMSYKMLVASRVAHKFCEHTNTSSIAFNDACMCFVVVQSMVMGNSLSPIVEEDPMSDYRKSPQRMLESIAEWQGKQTPGAPLRVFENGKKEWWATQATPIGTDWFLWNFKAMKWEHSRTDEPPSNPNDAQSDVPLIDVPLAIASGSGDPIAEPNASDPVPQPVEPTLAVAPLVQSMSEDAAEAKWFEPPTPEGWDFYLDLLEHISITGGAEPDQVEQHWNVDLHDPVWQTMNQWMKQQVRFTPWSKQMSDPPYGTIEVTLRNLQELWPTRICRDTLADAWKVLAALMPGSGTAGQDQPPWKKQSWVASFVFLATNRGSTIKFRVEKSTDVLDHKICLFMEHEWDQAIYPAPPGYRPYEQYNTHPMTTRNITVLVNKWAGIPKVKRPFRAHDSVTTPLSNVWDIGNKPTLFAWTEPLALEHIPKFAGQIIDIFQDGPVYGTKYMTCLTPAAHDLLMNWLSKRWTDDAVGRCDAKKLQEIFGSLYPELP